MKIGIFGGAFNPVHNGHIALAKHQVAALGLEKLLLIPTSNPPHKSNAGLLDGKFRVDMLKLAFADFENVEISTIEFESAEKSYTYDTIVKLKKVYPNDEFVLLIGSDQLFYFKKWYKYAEILDMVSVSAVVRLADEVEKAKAFINDECLDISLTLQPPFEVSSTEIRNMVKAGQDVSNLVPISVSNYIKENGLYV